MNALRRLLGRIASYATYYEYFGWRFVASLIFGRKDKTVLLFGRKLRYSNQFWLLHALKETFVDRLYLFETDNRTPLIVDCGSNIGVSLIYFKQLFPSSTVIGLEPDPKNFALLAKNVQSFALTDVQLIKKAAWSQNGVLLFAAKGSVGSRVIRDRRGAKNPIEVGAVSLADYLRSRPVDFLKVDIEGAEFEVLSACREHLHNVQNLFVEYHSSPENQQVLGELLLILRDAGFRYYMKEAWENQKLPFVGERHSTYDLQLNIFAYRQAGSSVAVVDTDAIEPAPPALLRRSVGA